MNPREQRLLALFVIALVVGGSWVGWSRLNAEVSAMQAQTEDLVAKTRLDQAQVEGFAEEMEAASAWIDGRTGEPLAPEEAQVQLLQAAQGSAREAGLTLSDTRFLEPHVRGRFRLARITGRVQGGEDAVYPWLASFHFPDKLQSVSGIQIKPDKQDDTIVDCEVEFAQWYLPAEVDE